MGYTRAFRPELTSASGAGCVEMPDPESRRFGRRLWETADGVVRIANACTNPDLLWALKGGGGGSFGVVTRLTLKTHELAERAGAAIFAVKAVSGPAFRVLIRKFVAFYAERLFNQHWGGRIFFQRNETLSVGMVSHGLDKAAAQAVWQPFFDWIAAAPQDYRLTGKPTIADMPARNWWDAEFRKKYTADSILDRSLARFPRCQRAREEVEDADHRHRLLLRAQGTCRGYRGAEQGNEAPTVHSMLRQPQPREN
jgi:hypothetical protein